MPCSKYPGLLATLILSTLIVFVAATAPGVSSDDDDRPPPPPKAVLTYPNLGSHLSGMVEAYEEGSASQRDSAERAPIHRDNSVAVTIYLTGNVSDVVQFLWDNGGDPRNVGEDYIEAYVPVSLLGRLSEQEGVARVREIVPPQPAQLTQRVIGNGPAVHGSRPWNNAGYTGQGVKVGVIDDFRGFSALQGIEVPSTAVARCYTDIGVFTSNLSDCEQVPEVSSRWWPECVSAVQRRQLRGAEHGTWVAESILDVAPGVTLYIANPGSKGDLQDTVDWMASQGVTVINYSVGWTFDGPGDGTSPLSVSPLNTVDEAVENGVLWVNSAGNNAEETWFGSWMDPDNDTFINFAGSDEDNDWPLRACRSYRVQLRWDDDWDGASTDLDLYIYDKDTDEIVLSSVDVQSGESGQVPYESISFLNRFNRTDWDIAVTHEGGDAPDWVQVVAWSVDPLEHHTLNGSITNPAESANRGLLAVGAAPWFNVQTIEPFSSQGPTPDGTTKPDIVGADCGETALLPLEFSSNLGGNCGFAGTSQAAPHVAGLAALVKQANPSYTPEQVADYLKNNAAERGASGADNTWGYGFAQLPAPPSQPTPGTDACADELTADGTTDGTWAAGCQSQESGRGYARYYGFTLTEQREVTITLDSDVDTYLYLRSGDNAKSGTAVGENDDHGTLVNTAACASASGLSQRDSCITVATLAAGAYTIEATTYNPATPGSFTLAVSGLGGTATGPDPGSGPGTDACADELTADGTTDGTWAAGCQSQESGRGYARYYGFTLTEQREVTITLDSDVDTYLYLRSGDNAKSGTAVGENDDHGTLVNTAACASASGLSQRDSCITVATLAAGAYTIEATTYNPATPGSFTLAVSGLGGGSG